MKLFFVIDERFNCVDYYFVAESEQVLNSPAYRDQLKSYHQVRTVSIIPAEYPAVPYFHAVSTERVPAAEILEPAKKSSEGLFLMTMNMDVNYIEPTDKGNDIDAILASSEQLWEVDDAEILALFWKSLVAPNTVYATHHCARRAGAIFALF